MSSGTSRELISIHYGRQDGGKKVYIQSSLHADEIPGMLVMQYLRKQLDLLEDAGLIQPSLWPDGGSHQDSRRARHVASLLDAGK